MSLAPSSTALFPRLLQLGVWKIDLFPEDEPAAFASRAPVDPLGDPLLSAALIVRDDERFLPTCLRSLEGLVDEVVVVDTGSRDRTVPLAEASAGFSGGPYATPASRPLARARRGLPHGRSSPGGTG